MKTALIAIALALVACDAVVVDLGRGQSDAAPDATRPDGNTCVCRVSSCRDAGDCTAVGGACGPDQFCVAPGGPCTTDDVCRALDPNAICTAAADSTLACGQ